MKIFDFETPYNGQFWKFWKIKYKLGAGVPKETSIPNFIKSEDPCQSLFILKRNMPYILSYFQLFFKNAVPLVSKLCKWLFVIIESCGFDLNATQL
jgi:hypothetical protein